MASRDSRPVDAAPRGTRTRASGVRWRSAVVAGVLLAGAALAVFAWPALRDARAHRLASLPSPCTPMAGAELERRQPYKLIVPPEVGGMGRFTYRSASSDADELHPRVAILAFDGWLLGGDEGEFVGGIVYQREGGQDFLASANVEDIFEMPFGFVATTGYSHLVGEKDSTGSLVLITREGAGTPVARKLHDLPAAASASFLLENGDLLIETANGQVLLDSTGSLRSIRCRSTRQAAPGQASRVRESRGANDTEHA